IEWPARPGVQDRGAHSTPALRCDADLGECRLVPKPYDAVPLAWRDAKAFDERDRFLQRHAREPREVRERVQPGDRAREERFLMQHRHTSGKNHTSGRYQTSVVRSFTRSWLLSRNVSSPASSKPSFARSAHAGTLFDG